MQTDKLLKMYEQMSIPQISEKSGIARSTIRSRLFKLGALRSRADGVRKSAAQGRLSGNKGVSRVFTDEWKENISIARKKWGDENAKGVSVKPKGYVEITTGDDKGRSQHRVEMERHLGRRLSQDEQVHHIDKDRSNNHISNLMVLSRSEHASLHAKENNPNRKRCSKGRYT